MRALIFVGDNQIKAEINEELQGVRLWFKRNHISITTDKTKYVVFHSRKIQPVRKIVGAKQERGRRSNTDKRTLATDLY